MTIAMLLRNTLEAAQAAADERASWPSEPGELIAAAGGVALLVALFLDWYAPPDHARGLTLDGRWQAFGVIDVLLALLALLAIAARRSSQRHPPRAPRKPVAAAVIASATCGCARRRCSSLYRILEPARPERVHRGRAPAPGSRSPAALVACGRQLDGDCATSPPPRRRSRPPTCPRRPAASAEQPPKITDRC